ncbi:CpaE-like family protein [Intrasporangium mesophilum]
MGNVIAFVPASGGVGASTLAAAVAVRAAMVGRSCAAVDLDRYAGSLEVTFGVEHSAGWRWSELSEVAGVVDGEALAAQLPMSCGVAVLAGCAPRGWGPAPGDVSGGPPDGEWTEETGEDEAFARPLGVAPAKAHEAGDFLAQLPDVVAGLSLALDLTVLDLSRDVDVLAAVAHLVDAVVVVAGSDIGQLTAVSHVVPGVRRVVRASRVDTGSWESGPPPLPVEPWLVLRGTAVEPALQDLVMDALDVALVAVVGDDRLVLGDLADGLPPGARARGDVVRAADAVLLRLARQELAA